MDFTALYASHKLFLHAVVFLAVFLQALAVLVRVARWMLRHLRGPANGSLLAIGPEHLHKLVERFEVALKGHGDDMLAGFQAGVEQLRDELLPIAESVRSLAPAQGPTQVMALLRDLDELRARHLPAAKPAEVPAAPAPITDPAALVCETPPAAPGTP